jgi:hypothetical protein
MFNNDENTILSFIFYTLYYGVNTTYNLFLLYCVSNTLAPKKTKEMIIDLSWYGMEIYTITEINIKEYVNKFRKSIIKKYPWLSINRYRNIPEIPAIMYLDKNGNIVNKNNENNNIITCIISKETDSEYYKVEDYTLDHLQSPKNKNLKNNENDKTNENNETNKLNYKLLVCSIDDNNGNKWFINLSKIDKNNQQLSYNFYLNGNILLTQSFLLYFVKNHYTDTNKKGLLALLQNGNYNIKILDNNAIPISWSGINKAIELHNNGPVVIELNTIVNKPRLSIDMDSEVNEIDNITIDEDKNDEDKNNEDKNNEDKNDEDEIVRIESEGLIHRDKNTNTND